MNKKTKTILMIFLFAIALALKIGGIQAVHLNSFMPTGEHPYLNTHFWLTDRLDTPAQFSYMRDRNLALDNNEQPHIAYGENMLYYAWHDGSSWHREIVDSYNHDAGMHATLALDSSGKPHIVYLQRLGPNSSAIRHAHKTERGWIFHVLAAGANIDDRDPPALSLDSQDRPHILYSEGYSGVRYAMWTGTQWIYETITNESLQYPRYPMLVTDSADNPHVVYLYNVYEPGTGIKYAHLEANAWVLETIDADVNSNSPVPSLAIDRADNLHLTYMKDSGLTYRQKSGNGWSMQTVTSDNDMGGLSLAVADNGEPHITYYHITTKELNYAYRSGGAWNVEMGIDIAENYFPYYYTSLVLDSENRPRVSYVNIITGQLKYARRDNDAWSLNMIDEAGTVGELSLSIDSKNNLHIGYIYNRQGTSATPILKYMQVSGKSWVTDLVDENVGWPEVATDSNGKPHLSYYDITNGDLKYAHLITDTWAIQIVDEQAFVGYYSSTSIAIDSTGNPHIAYYDSANESVKYAYLAGATWNTQTVDSVGELSENLSLALDSLNNPTIVYYDAEEIGLKAARLLSGTWEVELVESGPVHAISLALDSLDRPHVSYSHDNLKYARRMNTGWVFTTIDTGPFSPHTATSLILSNDDRPYIAYQTYFHYHFILKYVYWDGIEWIEHTPDTSWSVGYDVDLALDGDGQPYIAHRDELNGHLKLTKMADTVHFAPFIAR